MHMENIEKINLEGIDNITLQRLCGVLDQNLEQIGKQLELKITRQRQFLLISGRQAQLGATLVHHLLKTAEQKDIGAQEIHLATIALTHKITPLISADNNEQRIIFQPNAKTQRLVIQGKTPNQNAYIQALLDYDIVFGLGPAGTGKTYLAVAAAVEALRKHEIEKIILVRPAVEAGEKLGFLPGDLSQKIDPYLRPLYDALHEFMGAEIVNRLIEKGIIELAPLAYMRGRTLNHAFIILDEAQNTTKEQMKMFLTRIGFGTKTVITGDLTQIDLPIHIYSGLKDAYSKLKAIQEIYFHQFESKDIIRHPLVQKIVNAYQVNPSEG